MPVNTRRVKGRRTLRFETIDELLADSERLASTEVVMLGNWSLGQLLRHLAYGLDYSVSGFTFRLSFPVVLAVRLFLKKHLLTRGLPAGFYFFGKGASVMPGETSTDQGLSALRRAVARFKHETIRFPHPFFGKMTPEEWNAFQLRHAELHLSFAVPKAVPAMAGSH